MATRVQVWKDALLNSTNNVTPTSGNFSTSVDNQDKKAIGNPDEMSDNGKDQGSLRLQSVCNVSLGNLDLANIANGLQPFQQDLHTIEYQVVVYVYRLSTHVKECPTRPQGLVAARSRWRSKRRFTPDGAIGK